MNKVSYNREVLPPWFERPQTVTPWQESLFTDRLDEVLAALRVSSDDLARWRDRRWVSFGPDFTEGLEEPHVNEIRFVRDIARTGFSDAVIDAMLADLPRPMNFDPASVAYSFSLGWVQGVVADKPSVQAMMETHLDDWLLSLEADDLKAFRDRLDELIAATGAADEGRDDDGERVEE
jgi:hypothetical protein